MTPLCGAPAPLNTLPRPTVTNRNEDLAPAGACGSGVAAAFFDALHRRVCDRIAWDWARGWLATHARLEPSTAAGWPALRLVLTADPPSPASPYLLQRHYRDALALRGKAGGPLADLAAAVEVVE